MNQLVVETPSAAPAAPASAAAPSAAVKNQAFLRYNSQPGSPAESALVEQYIPLVKHIVARLAMSLPPHVDLQDVYSSGLIGLLNAIRNFNPEAGASFESYARFRIRGAIFDEFRKMDWVPRSVHEKARKVQVVMERLEQMKGRTPTPQEIAVALNISLDDYEQLMAEIKPATFVCLDSLVAQDGDRETSRHELVADDGRESPDSTADRKELSAIIAERLERLPEMQRKVLALYYFEDMRLREIAEVFGVTESRICQIHSQAILAIRSYIKNKTSLS